MMKSKACKNIDFSRTILDPPEIECSATGHEVSHGCITGDVECGHYEPSEVISLEEVMKKIRPINSKYVKRIAGVINEHDQRLIGEAQREILSTEPIKTLLEKLKEADGDLERIKVPTKDERTKTALKNLFAYKPECDLLDHDSDYYENGDENAPFMSEAYLYNLMGKEDARTFLALVHNIERTLGFSEWEISNIDDGHGK